MKNDQEKAKTKGLFGKRKVTPEEQGDLLVNAMTGLFSQQPVEDGSHDREEETSGENPERESDSKEDAEPIPDSPWERKMAWAKQRVREGRLEDAAELYRELVEEDPTSVRALNNLGVILDESGDPEGAVTRLQAARRIEPQNQEVLGNLGAALGSLGRFAESEEILRSAFRLDPSNLQIRTNLGILLFRRGLYEQAVVELEVVCAARPDDGLPHYYRGEALNRLGRLDEAIEALERATELIPGNSKVYYILGVLFDKKDLPDKAAAMYRKARELAGS